ncbi:MAG: ABC transporter substrate-binding protein [Agathobacter sp.]|nr:ABC transporter substrate-binding protein [Agathobacter sp.]
MKKRLISALLVSVMAMSLVACGGGSSNSSSNESKKYNIGICQLVQHDALDAATKGFKDALIEELGEDNVEFNEQNAQGDPNTCSSIINDFTNKKVDLILANATPALQAAASGTDSIPILGTSVTEYGVALDIDNFNGTVGKNISGTSDLAPLDKQAEMIKEIFPDAKKVGLLFCSAEPNSKYQVDTVQSNLEKLGYTCTQYSFQDSNELSAVATTAVSESDIIYAPTDNTVANNTELLYNTAIEKNVPVVAGEEGICKGCGTVTLSISYYDLGVATGKMAAKILKGEQKIEEMPIEYAPNFTKKYNKAICEKLNIKIPEGYEEIKE